VCSAVKDAPQSERLSQGSVRSRTFKELCEKAEDRYEDRNIDESLALGVQAAALSACVLTAPDRKALRDRAIKAATQAVQHFQDAGAVRNAALATAAIARLQLARERPDMAIRLAKDVLAMCQKAGDQQGDVISECIIVDAHILKATLLAAGKGVRQSHQLKFTPGERQEALKKDMAKHLDEALCVAPEALGHLRGEGDKRGEADMLCTLAEIHLGLGGLDESKEAAMLARDAFHDLEDRSGERTALLLELDAHIADKDGAEALDVGREIVKLFRKAKDRKGELEGMFTLLGVHQMMGQQDEVMKLANEIRAICKEERDVKTEGRVVDALMQAHIENGRVDDAIRTAEEAMELFRRASDSAGEALALHACGCLKLDRFFKDFDKDMEDFRAKGCMDKYWKGVNMTGYDEALGMINKAVRLFADAGDHQGQAMAEETVRSTEQRATMLNDPDVTKQIFKDGQVVDVVRTWNPGAKRAPDVALADIAG